MASARSKKRKISRSVESRRKLMSDRHSERIRRGRNQSAHSSFSDDLRSSCKSIKNKVRSNSQSKFKVSARSNSKKEDELRSEKSLKKTPKE
jgi:hypothetical protein